MSDNRNQQFYDLLKQRGITQFQIDSMKNAIKFLGNSMLLFSLRNLKTKQLFYLCNDKSVSDEELKLHIELNWDGLIEKDIN